MQKVDITELRRLHAAATEGDWVADYESKVGTRCILKGDAIQTFPMPAADAVFIAAAHNALPSLLDELEAARAELEALKVPMAIYEQYTKAIGAAEELERIAANWYEEMVAWTATDFEQRAAQLRQEVEGK